MVMSLRRELMHSLDEMFAFIQDSLLLDKECIFRVVRTNSGWRIHASSTEVGLMQVTAEIYYYDISTLGYQGTADKIVNEINDQIRELWVFDIKEVQQEVRRIFDSIPSFNGVSVVANTDGEVVTIYATTLVNDGALFFLKKEIRREYLIHTRYKRVLSEALDGVDNLGEWSREKLW